MTEVYIFTLNKVKGDDRLSFSMTINDLIPENILDSEKKELEKGYTIIPEEEENNPLFTRLLRGITEKGYYSPWMQEWTTATIYLLYKGEVETSL